jgi:hypothetical protein
MEHPTHPHLLPVLDRLQIPPPTPDASSHSSPLSSAAPQLATELHHSSLGKAEEKIAQDYRRSKQLLQKTGNRADLGSPDLLEQARIKQAKIAKEQDQYR